MNFDNFKNYFIRPRSKGFKKNLERWKLECDDYNEFEGIESPENIYHFYKPNKNMCQHPECNNKTQFISLGRGFKETCCRKHSMELTSLKKYGVKYKSRLPEFREKVKKTVKEKYGVDNVFQSEKIKKKTKQTCLKKYGAESPMHNDEIKQKVRNTTLKNHDGIGFQTGKIKETMMKKYGVEYASQIPEFQEKKKKTWLEKYGVENPMQNTEIQEKVKKTNLEKYGVENIFEDSEYIQKCFEKKYGVKYNLQVEEIRQRVSKSHKERYSENHWMSQSETIEKRKITYQKRFGVDHPMQTKEIFEKNMNSCYRRKKYKWKTGEISVVQGYEPIILSELEKKGYTYNEVKTKQKDIPSIWYMYKKKKHRYYPDIYIPKENLIIEVKSEFTLKNPVNEYKFQAVKDAGYNFKLEVR